MKPKAVLVGLSLLMFIFCTVSLSQAALDRRYTDYFLTPPAEHPWQESGSPPANDTIHPEAYSPFFIVIGPVKLIIIKPSPVRLMPNRTNRVIDWSNGKTPR